MKGYNNLAGKMVIDPGVEKADCFLSMKEAYERQGRIGLCECLGSCRARERTLQFVGLVVNTVFDLHAAGFTMTVQQLIGTRLFEGNSLSKVINPNNIP